MLRTKFLLTTAMTSAAVLLAPVAVTAAPTPGAPGIGDPYYPTYGNGGYDVKSYDIGVRYQPDSKKLTGTTTLVATATQDLSSFDLDFGLTASKVTVDGRPAQTRTDGFELIVTPSRPLHRHAPFVVTVEYSGTPSKVTIPGTTSTPWVTTPTGAVGLGEPEASAWWFPANDHPLDKATYRVAITAPSDLSALSNGNLVSKQTTGADTTWTWVEKLPQATYLAFMAIGRYDVLSGRSASGLPYTTAVAQGTSPEYTAAKKNLAQTGEVVDWLSKQWGRYPFDAIGGVVPDGEIGYALEDQTRPVYDTAFWRGGRDNISVVVHENAHQWFGDSVSVHHWRDMWLNEGFASFSEWLWSEQHAGKTGQQEFDALYAKPANDSFWSMVIGEPGAHHEFDGPVYDRGAMVAQALRNRVGDATFFRIIRSWVVKHRYGNARIEDFVALASKVAKQDLRHFFQVWLFTGEKPAPTVENGFPPDYKPAAPKAAQQRSLPRR
ncbi:M1 family metallopeptidase [Fodinicola acaciae]|uniref:M1 family metallopeptidase n=1 Tax=Fodinicola acaciae TaxID=2681555 RepID=UPI0013D21E2F|nr:M1 family metallopeptidase [Fodinicola acaciae]